MDMYASMGENLEQCTWRIRSICLFAVVVIYICPRHLVDNGSDEIIRDVSLHHFG